MGHGERTPIAVDVADVLGLQQPTFVRGWVLAPDPPPASAPVVYCLAGGHCSTDYFDLRVGDDDTYRMAAHFARNGIVVVAVDHPGIGSSDPVPDIFTLTPSVVAAVHAKVHLKVVQDLRHGALAATVPPIVPELRIGLGHSMGGMLIDVLQARHRPFAAIVGLGHTGNGLPQVLTHEELAAVDPRGTIDEDHVIALARARFSTATPGNRGSRSKVAPNSFFLPDVPSAVVDAFRAQQAQLLCTCGLVSMLPRSTDVEKAAIDVPLFLGFGDHDLGDPSPAEVERYRGTSDVTYFVLRDSAHCHNQATTRVLLWDRIVQWIEERRRAAASA